jgi:hypothetical protein
VKLIRLADEGDNGAQAFRKQVTDAQDQGLTSEGVSAMQKIEGALVDKAVEFELIDTIGKRELDRIREDRHLCAHPSLRTGGEVYNPRAETARGHLANALATLLVHPPTQGGTLLEEFKNFICDPLFAPSLLHIRATFHHRVRVATRENIIRLAPKAAMLKIDPGGRMPADAHADRMAVALRAFAEASRDTVRDAVGEARERLQVLDGAVQLRVLLRMTDDDYFWASVDQPLTARFQALLDAPLMVGDKDPLPPEIAMRLAVGRQHLCQAASAWTAHSIRTVERTASAAGHRGPYGASAEGCVRDLLPRHSTHGRRDARWVAAALGAVWEHGSG